MKLKGYMSIEATYIFTIVTLIVVSLIRFDFYLHDNLLNDTCKVLGGIRYYQAERFYYNGESIREKSIANSPVLGEDYDFVENAYADIEKNVKVYYEEKNLGLDGGLSNTALDKIVTIGDNANLVRSGGQVVKLIGGIADAD